MEVVAFKREHLFEIELKDMDLEFMSNIDKRQMDKMENQKHALTFFKDNEPLMCAGVLGFSAHRGELWAVVSKKGKLHAKELYVASTQALEEIPLKRLEAVIDCDFETGHRWIKNLGFKLEAKRMKAYGHGGVDCALYAIVRGD